MPSRWQAVSAQQVWVAPPAQLPAPAASMPPKGGKGGSRGDYGLDAKGYQAALQEVFKGTAVKASDIDPKAVQLLDALQNAGKSGEACAHLLKSLETVPREKVDNWKAYVFTLLRAFDPVVYNAMKEQRGRPKPRSRKELPKVGDFSFRAEAVEFVPGTGAWGGAAAPAAAAPAAAPGTDGASGAPAAAPTTKAPPAQAKASEGGFVLRVECGSTKQGEVVAAVGSTAELGSWDPTKALKLTTSEADYPVWKSAPVPVADGTEVEYKFIVIGEDEAVSQWEPIEGNRKLKVGSEPGTAKFGTL